MSRYRRHLTRPEIARLADETTELRRELQDLVSRGRTKVAHAMDSQERSQGSVTAPAVTGTQARSSGRGRKRR